MRLKQVNIWFGCISFYLCNRCLSPLLNAGTVPTVCYIFVHFIIGYEKNPAELQLLKKIIWLWLSSVIKIVKMKYNRIICWLVSTSFKIYLDILSYFYITFTIFYYNIISLKWTFFPFLVKGLYQTVWFCLIKSFN
jgi:hypothetical protein